MLSFRIVFDTSKKLDAPAKSFRTLHDAASVMLRGSSLLNIGKILKDARPSNSTNSTTSPKILCVSKSLIEGLDQIFAKCAHFLSSPFSSGLECGRDL